MNETENLFTFHIDSMSPETLTLARLIKYLDELAALFGHKEHVHFLRVSKGSAVPEFLVDTPSVPKVRTRLMQAGGNDAPAELARHVKSLNRLLREDNAVGEIRFRGEAKILQFPGRLEEPPEEIHVSEPGTLEGTLVRLGGKDETAHATIETEPGVFENFSLNRSLAKQLAPFLYGSLIRVEGKARWRRNQDGRWCLDAFTAETFEPVEDPDATRTMRELAALKSNDWYSVEDPLEELLRIRGISR